MTNKTTGIKRLAALLLTAAVAVSTLSGCSALSNNSPATSSTNVVSTAEVSDEFVFSMGEWNENVYTNEAIGIKLELPEDCWTPSGYDELYNGFEFNPGANPELANEQYEAKVTELFENNSSVSIMKAVGGPTKYFDTIEISMASRESWMYSEYETAEEKLQHDIKDLTEHYKMNNMDGKVSDIGEMELCGQTFYYIDDTYKDSCTRKAYNVTDDYWLNITFTVWETWEGCMDEYCSYFK